MSPTTPLHLLRDVFSFELTVLIATYYSIDSKSIAAGNLIEEVNKIKSQTGGDIVVYGGASFDTYLIKGKLIDEFYLFINPVAIGNGMTIFMDLNEIQNYTLIESKPFDCGKVLLRYEAGQQ